MKRKYKTLETEWFCKKLICLEDIAMFLNRKKYRNYKLLKVVIDKQSVEKSAVNVRGIEYKATALIKRKIK